MERTSDIRQFGEKELEALRVIECLKKSGLEIKDIKQFMDWCVEGAATYPQRKELFEKQRKTVEAEIEHVNKVLDMIKFKCWYYEQAMQDGSEDQVQKIYRNCTITHIAKRKEFLQHPKPGIAGILLVMQENILIR